MRWQVCVYSLRSQFTFVHRHYDDNDAAWAKHCTYKKHKDWLLIRQGRQDELAVASHAFRPAHQHEWFQQSRTSFLRDFAEQAQLSFTVVKHFSSRSIVDGDLLWLVGEKDPCVIDHSTSPFIAGYPDERMLSDLGLTPAQAHMLRYFANRVIEDADAQIADDLAAP